MEGPLQLLDSGKPVEMFVILFDDMLLITRRKKALSKKVNISTLIPEAHYFNYSVGQKYRAISGKIFIFYPKCLLKYIIQFNY